MSGWLGLLGTLALLLVLPFVLLRAPWMRDPAPGKRAGTGGVAPAMADFTIYSTTWCGFCRRLKTQLDQAGIAYDEVDIERDPEAAKFVEGVNRGNQVVPTLKFADGSTATNPSLAQVQAKLAA